MQDIKILLPENSGIYRLAAKEFSSFWKTVTGTLPSIVTVPDDDSDMIIFGSDAENLFVHGLIMSDCLGSFKVRLGTDDYHLLSVKNKGRKILIFAFGRPRALLYAVYHFFELRASCRYFWDGDITPRKNAIDIMGLDIAESPRFQYRGLRYFAHRSLDRFQAEHWDLKQWKQELRWIVKKRMNIFMLRIGIDDIFQKAFPDTVNYPEYSIPEAKERSYDDRTLFWSMKCRSRLRKQILAYARRLDLMHPEDVGTMTHWYSRTPLDFLKKVKPELLSQTSTAYAEKTGLVWDIRKNANLEYYFKLAQAHIKYYGSHEIFHTIGLAERNCFSDRKQNHKMKLYAYRRIIARLRKSYPNAPLLIGSWDFSVGWNPEEVRALVKELDPENTLFFDYTADVPDEKNYFENWGIVGKFPWIFGIFHAYEPASELRGHYDLLEERIPRAVTDRMCKGLMLWPECSHSDTLMLEYLAANAWNPSKKNVSINSFLKRFIEWRYPSDISEMTKIWEKALPLVKALGWPPPQGGNALHAGFSDPLFRIIISDFMSELSEENIDCHQQHLKLVENVIHLVPELLTLLSEKSDKHLNQFIFRDILDLARTAVSRMQIYGFSKLAIMMEEWQKGLVSKENVFWLLNENHELIRLEGMILDSHQDYSLYDSLLALQRKYPTNSEFEYTLKGNTENSYCRSYASEMFNGVYLNEFSVYKEWVTRKLEADDRSNWHKPDELFKAASEKIRNTFYTTPLAELAPNHETSRKALSRTLLQTAAIASSILERKESL